MKHKATTRTGTKTIHALTDNAHEYHVIKENALITDIRARKHNDDAWTTATDAQELKVLAGLASL